MPGCRATFPQVFLSHWILLFGVFAYIDGVSDYLLSTYYGPATLAGIKYCFPETFSPKRKADIRQRITQVLI